MLDVIFGHSNHSALSDDKILRKVAENEDKKNLAEKLGHVPSKKDHHRLKEILSLKITYNVKEKIYNLYIIEKWKGSQYKSYEFESRNS